MPTAILLPPTVPARPAPGSHHAGVVQFLTGWATTLLPLLVAVTGLELGWSLLGGTTWLVAGAGVVGWALFAAGWLLHRDWHAGAVVAALGAPVAVLAGPAALGWLAPAGAVLWGPVSAVLTVALAMAAQPLTPNVPPSAEPPARG
ncbi:hypothetical protein ACI792_05720 [Blastococcus sp. SYSU DS0669]